ncbi:MAG: HD domain-containing protein [Bacteroidia bacterium]|nr:CCA tRNA nucleotidyltransferase [Bacteroidia bacterium]MDW8016120.1 HD domain-containing protein [Bacteroidia bacterium]
MTQLPLSLWEADPILPHLSAVADELNQPSYIVGGWVRDFFLKGGDLGSSIDVVTIGNPTLYAERLAQRLGTVIAAEYRRFYVAVVKWKAYEIEVVASRRESYSPASRNPAVEPAPLEEDFMRRDFTINALYVGLHAEQRGVLLDPFGGIRDLGQRLIRTPVDPQRTFSDDPLRMLRAVRFAVRLDFRIESRTYEALKSEASRLSIVSPERIIEEFHKILMSPNPTRGLQILYDTGLLHQFLPEVAALAGTETQKGYTHKDNFAHTLKVLDQLLHQRPEASLWLRWAALLHDIGKPFTKRFDDKAGWTFHLHEEEGARRAKEIFRRLHLPLDERLRYIQKLIRLHGRPIALAQAGVTDSAIRRLAAEAGEALEDLILLCRSDVTTRNPNRRDRFLQNFDKVMQRVREVQEKDHLARFQPPIRGEEIMRIYNLNPGPLVGAIKEAIRQAILDGIIPNEYDSAYEYMQKIAPYILSGQPIPEELRQNADNKHCQGEEIHAPHE